nr:putative ribonuclease H-like domain-containing protein [Tanacetum cinerariifolium]
MTRNKAYLVDYQDYNGGPVAFGGSKGHITGKGKIRTGKLDFEDVCFVKELQHFDLFSVSQMCDKKNKFLFTNTECLVLSPDSNMLDQRIKLTKLHNQKKLIIVQSSEATNGGENPKKDIGLKSNEKLVDWEEQPFLEELERLKRQEKEANDEAKSLRKESAQDKSWVDAMQEELLQFKIQKVWILVDLPFGKKEIGTKWVYMNKKDERGVVVRNKARLVTHGHRKEERIDYDEIFAPVARIEAIWIFLAFTSFMGFIVYQMDVKSTFLYGIIDEEVVWYATLSSFLLKNGYRRGTIDNTLFIKKDKKDIMLVQVYVDDIIFGYTKKFWCDEFEALMKRKFMMSYMGELTFFLGLQVKKKKMKFSCQDKYVTEILKKFDFISVKTASTPIKTQKPLTKDEEAVDVNVHLFRFMIDSLMYLTSYRPDIMFAVCACSRFQVTSKTSHLHAVKRIFRYLKGKPKLGLWYPRVSSFDLEVYSDSDYARVNLDRKSTIGGCQFLGKRLISWQCKKQTFVATSTTEAEYVVVVANYCGQLL